MRTQCSHPDCNACAREFFRWLKSRMVQMTMTRPGETSFAEAAATSVRPPR